MKKIVVIVPAFNEEKTISKTLDGLHSIKSELSSKGYELIIYVINDGSSDSTEKVANKNGYALVISHKKMKVSVQQLERDYLAPIKLTQILL